MSRMLKFFLTALAIIILGAMTAMSPAPVTQCYSYAECDRGQCRPVSEDVLCTGLFMAGGWCQEGCPSVE